MRYSDRTPPDGKAGNREPEKERLKNQLSAIVEFSDDAIIGVSKDLRITSWNTGAENIYGYTAEEVLDHHPDFLLPDNKKKEVQHYLRDVFKGHTIRHFETQRLHKNGTIIQISLSVSPLKDENGTITGAATIGRDITEQKIKEWALRESEEKYRSIFEYSGDGIFLMKEEILDCNQQIVQMLGYPKEELIGKRPEALSPKNQPDGSTSDREARRFITQALRGETPQFYWKHQRKNGELVDTQITLNHVKTSKGSRIIAMVRDISEQIQHQRELEQRNDEIRAQNTEFQILNKELAETNEALKASENKFRTLFNSISDAIFIHDFQGHFLEINQQACNQLGYSKKELLNMDPSQLDSRGYARKFPLRLEKLKQQGQLFFETQHVSKDGKHIPTELHARMIQFNAKPAILTVARDITRRKEAERKIQQFNRELIQAKEHAEESDRLKSAFLANMSHEIRTPMNGIIGFAQLLKTPNLSEEKQNEFIEIIDSRSQQLLQIINDIIDISMIEANQLQLQPSEMVLNDLMEELYLFHSQLLENHSEKKVACFYRAPLKADECLIHSDAHRLRQILSNLLSNAIKFTHAGQIEFGYQLHQPDKLLFYVEDTGIGIPDSAKEKIFERFRQADDSITRSYGGTGLGLALTRKLVERMGGEIWVESTQGVGTCFCFTLPYKPLPNSSSQEDLLTASTPIYDWSRHTILVVEDDPSSQKLIREMLEPTGGSVIMANNGYRAWEVIQGEAAPSLILMDIKLPDQDGLELTRNIKKHHPNLPVIAQSAYAMSHDRNKCLQAGCDDYLSKPLDPSRLLDRINRQLKKS